MSTSTTTATATEGARNMHVPVLHHVSLKTRRLAEMVEWYRVVAGLEVVHLATGGAWLTNDTANHRLGLLSTPVLEDDPGKLHRTGLHHTAFEYASLDELLDTFERLAALDIKPHACLDHGMTTSFYYLDPDGNSVELQSDNFGDWGESTRFMRETQEFADDPIGVSVDPARMAAARAAGADPDELHRRAYAREFEPPEPLDLRLPTG